MTIKELKSLLMAYDDDARVVLASDEEGNQLLDADPVFADARIKGGAAVIIYPYGSNLETEEDEEETPVSPPVSEGGTGEETPGSGDAGTN